MKRSLVWLAKNSQNGLFCRKLGPDAFKARGGPSLAARSSAILFSYLRPRPLLSRGPRAWSWHLVPIDGSSAATR